MTTRAHHARGMTLAEVLLAMTLLSGLVAAGGTFLVAVTKASARIVPGFSEERALNAVVRQIEDDLATGDGLPELKDKVRSDDSRRLWIRTRAPKLGPVERTYRFETATGRLWFTEKRFTDGAEATSALLDGLAAFKVELDPKEKSLDIRLAGTHGTVVSGSWRSP